MNVVYLVQAGEQGPVKIGTTTLSRLERRLAEGQCWNTEALLIRELYVGDALLERRLHSALRPWNLNGEWFRPEVLDKLPDNLDRVPFDRDAEQRKLTGRALRELARREPPDDDNPAAHVAGQIAQVREQQDALRQLAELARQPPTS